MLTITVEESHPSLAGADTLVVFLHANTISVDSLSAIAAATNEVVPGARFIEPFSLMGCLSFEDPTYITREFVLQIDDQWEEYRRRHGRDYKEIILVGYDLDALLVRKVQTSHRGPPDPEEAATSASVAFARSGAMISGSGARG